MSIAANIKSIQDFFEELATSHIDLEHGKDGQKSFFRLESWGELGSQRTAQSRNIVVVLGYPGQAAGPNDPGKIKRNLVLRIASYAGSATGGNRTEAIAKSEEILLDILARLEFLMGDDDYCFLLRGLDLDGATWEEIEEQPWLVNHFGWDLAIPFRAPFPSHDAAKWK